MAKRESGFQHHWMGNRAVMRYMFVTIALLVISVTTSMVSRVGGQLETVDVLFFSSQLQKKAAVELYLRAKESGDEAQMVAADHAFVKVGKSDGLAAFRDVQKGDIWRLVTPMFLHMDILHIVFNMMWLWQFGVFLETRFGSWKYLGMVLVIAMVSNIVQAWCVGTSFGGMSGVNYGMFGFLMMRSLLHPDPGFALRKDITAWMLIWLVVCMTGRMGPVANHAHVGGMLCGGIFGTVHALRAGAWSIMRRRKEFRSAYKRSENSLYSCVVCGATEISHPERTFAVCGEDGKDYCAEHLDDQGKVIPSSNT